MKRSKMYKVVSRKEEDYGMSIPKVAIDTVYIMAANVSEVIEKYDDQDAEIETIQKVKDDIL